MSDLSESLALNLSNVQRLDDSGDLSDGFGACPQPVTLDDLLIPNPAATVIFPVRDHASRRFGLNPGDLLVVERTAHPQNNQLVIILINDELLVERFVSTAARDHMSRPSVPAVEQPVVWGVVTYRILKQR